MDDAVLRDIRNDLQFIVDCTRHGDKILFDTEDRIRLASRVTIPWSLTLSVVTKDLETEGGVLRQIRRKATFICPNENEGVFHVKYARRFKAERPLRVLSRANDVLFAHLGFEECLFHPSDRQTSSIIDIDACEDEDLRRSVLLYHVHFSRNRVGPSAFFRVQSPSCVAVEMFDVSFRENNCSAAGCVQLSLKNTLDKVTLRRNRVAEENHESQVFFYAPPRSHTAVWQMVAVDNQGVLFDVLNGNVTLSDSSFRRHSYGIAPGRDPTGTCIRLVGSVAVVTHSKFRQNTGYIGAVIHAVQSNVEVRDSFFVRNTAKAGGAVSVDENSFFSADRCVFRLNFARISGGAVFSLESEVRGVGLSFNNNTSLFSGGGIHLERSSRVELVQSTFRGNEAGFGGSIFLLQGVKGSMENCSLSDSNSTSGGHVYVGDSEMSCDKCRMHRGNADNGVFFFLYTGSLHLLESELDGGQSNLSGGGIFATDESTVTAKNTAFKNCSAGNSGGVIYMKASTFTADNTTFEDNKAEDMGGSVFAKGESVLRVSNSRFSKSFALTGGTVAAEMKTTVNMTDCSFSDSTAQEFGGIWFVQDNSTAILDRCTATRGAAKSGGVFHVSDNSSIHIETSNMTDSTAMRGGCISIENNSDVKMMDVVVENARAEENGGALHLGTSTVAIVKKSIIQSCKANARGGAIYATGSKLEVKRLLLRNISAGLDGGGIYAGESSVVKIKNTNFTDNKARGNGGGMALEMESTGTLAEVLFTRLSVFGLGGAVHVQESTLSIQNGKMMGCHAEAGSCLSTSDASTELTDTTFEDGHAIFAGGLVLADNNSTVRCKNVTMAEGVATSGGAVALFSSSLEAQELHISNCRSQQHGGAIMGNGSATVHCTACNLQENMAKNKGGAISVETDGSHPSVVSLNRSKIRNNTAEYGGNIKASFLYRRDPYLVPRRFTFRGKRR